MEMMKIDPDAVRRLREERAWSQEHLAAVANLSLRTVQRVESEANASAETRMALATAFGVSLDRLKPTEPLPASEPTNARPPSAPEAVSSGPPPAAPRLVSYSNYRVLRFAVVLALIVGIDIYQTGRLTWSRWVLVFGVAMLVLRLFKYHFVEPRGRRARRPVSRNA